MSKVHKDTKKEAIDIMSLAKEDKDYRKAYMTSPTFLKKKTTKKDVKKKTEPFIEE